VEEDEDKLPSEDDDDKDVEVESEKKKAKRKVRLPACWPLYLFFSLSPLNNRRRFALAALAALAYAFSIDGF
jgi:hypothetical protein